MAIKKYIGPNRLSEIFSYIKAELDKKVTAVSGKGLSSNDYTTTEKNKLAGISSGAEVNVQSDWDEGNTGSDAYILHKPTSMPASDVPSWAKQPNKPSYTFSEIASKPTTIAGYGITDAKIANGTITLGSNSITPLTQHQDISGKADKATTLAGYGITDAKIVSGTITLGANTITPLTQHQSVTDNNPTLSWGTKSKVATIGSTAINVTMPSNPNTDTKVTSVGNHYAPAEDSTAQLDADASSSTAATWNSTSLVTGVTVKRDAKGHVTGLAVDSIKMPANPNTNTTYTFANGTNGFTVTPSGGTAQTVKVTPSITNNVTGSGTSGYLAKFNGANTITSGPQLGSSTTTYLRNDGSWATPTDTNTTYTIATGDSNGQIKITPSSGNAYNVGVKGLGSNAYTSTAYVPVRKNTDTYTTLASYYSGRITPTYVRISFPEGVANIWFMLNMEIFIRHKYSTDTAGKIIVNVHHGTGSPGTWIGNAITYGLPTDVRVYGSDGRYIYIIAIESYTTVVINSAIVGDSARSVDLSGTTIDNVTEIPTTYQTFTMQRGIDTSNYTDYTVKKDGTGASGTWGINVTGSAGSVAWANVSGRPTNVSSFTNDSGYITSRGSCASAIKATQDSSGNVITSTYSTKSETTIYKGNLTSLGSGTPAAATQTYWESNSNIPINTVSTAYNTSGDEYTLILSKGGSNSYGSVLKYGYTYRYLYILRRSGGTWQSTDWEKIYAGYADSAGSATTATTASKLGSSNVGSATQPIYLAAGTATACTYTLGKSVPSDAVFTDTNDKVTQTATTVNTYTHYEVLLSGTNDNTTRTEQTRKTNRLTFDPYMAMLTIGESSSSSGNGMNGRIYLRQGNSTAQWSIGPEPGGQDGETYSISLPLKSGIAMVQTSLGEAHLYGSTGLANSTKIPTGADVLSYGFIRIGVKIASVSYSTGRYVDINVTQLTGKNILGILNVNVFGSRDNASYGIVDATPSSYKISVSIYTLSSGGTIPASTSAHNIQIWYYY